HVRSARVATFRPYYYIGSRRNITLKRHNNEYAISGTNGLILHLRDHRRIVLGTRRPQELSQKINKLAAQGLLPDFRVF
ncbi:MAG: hypothetical protein H7257_09710, partial [Taibaiella sp.]|nr:hypothetical protein [Taibaiella sp.]